MDNNIDIKINLNRTTFQMTESFQKNENVKILPMDLFYGWNDNDLSVIDDLKNKVLCCRFMGI